MEAVEPMGFDGRTARGRTYAVSGQVVALEVEGSDVRAKVMGMRLEPYSVEIKFTPLNEAVRKRIVTKLRGEVMLLARLLAGEFPLDVEKMFREEGAQLFPGGKIAPGKYDVTIGCSCPDWANPCKHSCAVLMILGEEIARRPLTLLELRGIREEELIDED
jgi:uncharacterized Zn finger protein